MANEEREAIQRQNVYWQTITNIPLALGANFRLEMSTAIILKLPPCGRENTIIF